MTDTDDLLIVIADRIERRVEHIDDRRWLVSALGEARAQIERLRAAASGVFTCCRECRDQEPPITTPADFILWGKLLPPEALGPKCYDHAVKHIGSSMPNRAEQYAVVDLRPLRATLSPQDIE